MTTYAIIGANLAGGRAAETLRAEGFDGRIVLVGAEPDRPYERPPLSKDALSGKKALSTLFLRPHEFYSEHKIDLWLGVRATQLNPREHLAHFSDGRALQYDKLLIATGADPVRLTCPGADFAGIHYLRDLADTRALRTAMAAARRVVVVGGGFIGAEVAATFRQAGLEVTLIEAQAAPMSLALGETIGAALGRVHERNGALVRCGEKVVAFEGSDGAVTGVRTDAGAVYPADVVVVGVGVRPAVGWLEGSGVALDNGVLVDEYCRTSMPDVFAAGDVARWWHPTLKERLRVEHYDNAQNQGVAAAKAMLDRPVVYAPIPFFWSDQYDLNLQYVGHASGQDQLVLRGDPDRPPWSAWYVRDGVVRAALAVNRFRDIAAARQLIAKAAPVDPAALADESVDLRALARSLG